MAHPHYIKNENLNCTYDEVIPNSMHTAFVFRIFKDKYIYDYRHLHSEFELIFIKRGNGNKNIGDINQACKKNDLTLIGSAIPHFYYLNPDKGQSDTEVWVIHFDKYLLGSNFLEYSENKLIKKLFEASSKGVQFNYKTSLNAFVLMEKIKKVKSNDRIILFIQQLFDETDTFVSDILLMH